jgi:hypothetical protein
LYVIMTSNYACATNNPATSNIVHMIVNTPLPVSVTAAPSQNNICSNTSITFTATPTNGGTPSYTWYRNGSAVQTSGTPNYTPTLPINNGETFYVRISSSLSCVTGNPANSTTTTMIVTPTVAASVSIAGPGGDIPADHWCINQTVLYTATPTNGGTAPAYEWHLNSAIVGSNSPTYTYPGSALAKTDTLWVKMASDTSLHCVTGSPYTTVKKLLVIGDCVGIDELSDISSVVVYPNPTNDKLYVNFGELKEVPETMKVYNTVGQICFQTEQPLQVNQRGIDVTNMSPGTYTLQIVFGNNIVNKRFIVR